MRTAEGDSTEPRWGGGLHDPKGAQSEDRELTGGCTVRGSAMGRVGVHRRPAKQSNHGASRGRPISMATAADRIPMQEATP